MFNYEAYTDSLKASGQTLADVERAALSAGGRLGERRGSFIEVLDAENGDQVDWVWVGG